MKNYSGWCVYIFKLLNRKQPFLKTFKFTFRVLLLLLLVASNTYANHIPDFYSEPGFYPFRDYLNQNDVDFIDNFSGALNVQQVDLFIPGHAGFNLEVRRVYTPPQNGSLTSGESGTASTGAGVGWTINYGRVLNVNSFTTCPQVQSTETTENSPVFEREDGSRRILYRSSLTQAGITTNDYITTDRWRARCQNFTQPSGLDGAGQSFQGLVITSPDGKIYEMGARNTGTGTLYTTRIIHSSGNHIDITYINRPSHGHLVNTLTMKNISGVQQGNPVTLTYADASQAYARVTMISDILSQWIYEYSLVSGVSGTFYHLTRVRRQDFSSWRYNYYDGNGTPGSNPTGAGAHALKQITTPWNGNIDYTYQKVCFEPNNTQGTCFNTNDLTTSIKTRAVSGQSITPGTWTYDFNVPFSAAPGTPQTTTVTAPHGIFVYKHFSFHTINQTGDLWKVGLMQEKQIKSLSNVTLQTETMTWQNDASAKSKISDQLHKRPFRETKFDNDVFAPLLTRVDTVRDGATYITQFPLADYDFYGNAKKIIETGKNGSATTPTKTTDLTFETANLFNWFTRLTKTEAVSGIPGNITRTFNNKGQVTSENRYGVTNSFQYDNLYGNVNQITDPRGKIRTFSNFFRGIPETENHPEGKIITRDVNQQDGTINWERNGRGFQTNFDYDSLKRLTLIDPPHNDSVNIVWSVNDSSQARRTLTRGANKFRDILRYDGFGRVVKRETSDLARGITITNESVYDATGRLIQTAQPYQGTNPNRPTSFSYDALDRITNISKPNPENGANVNVSYNYLTNNNTVRITNERGLDTDLIYRSYGDSNKRSLTGINVKNSSGTTIIPTTITRNNLDQITAVNQGGMNRAYGYDSRKYLTSIVNPETGTTILGRDASGNLTSRKVGASGTTTFEYDDLNRLEFIRYPGSSSPNVTFIYDANDNVTKSIKDSITWDYIYDPNDNLTEEKLTMGTDSMKLNYTYSSLDFLNTITYPGATGVGSGITVAYNPDNLGRPRNVNFDGNTSTVTPHLTGWPDSILYANGAVSDIQFNNRLFPKTLQSFVGGASDIVNLTYTYDGKANITNINDQVRSTNKALSYDAADRLTSISGDLNWSATYSATGNITSKLIDGAVRTYSYDASNRLTSVSGMSDYNNITYDAYGNITQRGTNMQTFVYDDLSNLISVDSSSLDMDYEYDANNRRTIERDNGNIIKYSVYGQNGQLLHEKNPQTGDYTDYIYLNNSLFARRDDCSTDSDSDQIPDCVEIRNGTDPNSSNNTPPTVTNPGTQTHTEGDSVSLQIQASDPDAGDTLTYSATGLPTGLSINNSSGLINGTVTAAGTFNPIVTVDDGNGGSDTASFTWDVQTSGGSNNPPTITNPGNQTHTEGGSVSLQIQASDPDAGDTLTYSATGLPTGLSINSATGLITGTVTTANTFNTTVTVDDGNGGTDNASFTWTIQTAGQTTTFEFENLTIADSDGTTTTSIKSNTGASNGQFLLYHSNAIGEFVTFPITVSSAGTYSLDLQYQLNVSRGTFQVEAAESLAGPYTQIGVMNDTVSSGASFPTLSMSTTFATSGTKYLRFTATGPNPDSGSERMALDKVDVTSGGGGPNNTPPTVTNPGTQTHTEGDSVSLQIQASDPDAGDTLTYSATGLPTGLSINNSSGLINGTVTAAGTFNPIVTVDDGNGGSDTASFTWDVQTSGGSNNPPTITNPGNQTHTEGGSVSLQIQASDPDAGDTLTYSATGLPTGLSINSATGLITGTVTTANTFNTTVTVDDGNGGTDNASFTWTIQTAGQTTTFEFENLTIADSDGTTTTSIKSNTGASNGQFLLYHSNAIGEFVTFPITVSSAGTYSLDLQYQLNVSRGTFQVEAAESLAGPYTQIGVMNDTVSSGASFPTLSMSTTFATSGTKYLRFTATGPNPDSGSERMALDKVDVTSGGGGPNNTPPTVTNPGTQTHTEGDSVSLQIQASDPDAGDTLTYSATGLPTGLSINNSSGLINGTVTTAGTFNPIVTVDDGNGGSDTASFTWDVQTSGGSNNPPTITNPGNQTHTEGGSVSVQIQASDPDAGDTLTYSATGLPTGLSINSATGLITGTVTTANTFNTTVTVDDGNGGTDNASFTWTIQTAGQTTTFEFENLTIADSDGTTTTSIKSNTGASNGQFLLYHSNAIGEFVTFPITVSSAGTYSLDLQYQLNVSRGTFQVEAAESLAGPYTQIGVMNDTVSSGASFPTLSMSTTFATSGTKYLRFTATGPNPDSGSERMALDKVDVTSGGN